MRRLLGLVLLATLTLPVSAAAMVRLEIATVDAAPGERVSVAVRLTADASEDVTTVGNDISFDPRRLSVATSPEGYPDCRLEPGIQYFVSAFFFEPPDCDFAAGECSAVRVIAALLRFDRPLDDGLILYRCNVDIEPAAPPGVYRLLNSEASYSTADAVEGPVVAVNGAIVVGRDRITPAPASPTPSAPRTTRPTAPVLAADCTGDCDASDSVSELEEGALLHAVFDASQLADCVGSMPSNETRATAANLLGAVRARLQGCGPPTPTPTTRWTSTRTPTSTATESPSVPPTIEPSTPTARPRSTRSATRTPTPSRTMRPSLTSTRTRVRSPSPTPTPTKLPATPTATPGSGPVITFVGIARGDGRLVSASGDIEGVPLYDLATGTSFHLVVEGGPGDTFTPVGRTTYAPGKSPDLEVQTDRALGNGSGRVCSGGVPGFDPPRFDDSDEVIDAFNDVGCHFADETCVLFSDGRHGFVVPGSAVQFCAQISTPLRFGRGETRVSVRLRDRDGIAGEVAQIIVRVGN